PIVLYGVQAGMVLCIIRSAYNRDIVVVGCSRAFYSPLPIGLCPGIIGWLHGEPIIAHKISVLFAIHHVVVLGYLVHGHITVVGDIGLSGSASFGRHNDDTIRGFRSVDGCCRSVAEHIDAFDVVWRYEAEGGSGYAINDVIGLHRGSATQGGCTPQTDGRGSIRVTVVCRDG